LLVRLKRRPEMSGTAGAELQKLPAPATAGGMPLYTAIQRRRSQREFTKQALTPEQISQLCWCAQGITGPEGERASPSAGAIFPFFLYAVTPDGVYEYLPQEHALRLHLGEDVRRRLQAVCLDQSCVGGAPLNLIMAADVAKMAARYRQRAEFYCTLEAGHIAQNVLLVAVALGLGAVPVGAYDDDAVARVLKLPQRLRVLYIVPVGYVAG